MDSFILERLYTANFPHAFWVRRYHLKQLREKLYQLGWSQYDQRFCRELHFKWQWMIHEQEMYFGALSQKVKLTCLVPRTIRNKIVLLGLLSSCFYVHRIGPFFNRRKERFFFNAVAIFSTDRSNGKYMLIKVPGHLTMNENEKWNRLLLLKPWMPEIAPPITQLYYFIMTLTFT